MTFAESIRVCFSKYADFNGTASRPEFWWFMLFVYLVAAAMGFFSTTLVSLFCLVVLLPYLAVGARRLHDTGKSAWWLLLWIVPFGVIVLIVFWVQESKS
jgi:uncharacterized membrane protein YhaH (DUF805 family)